MEHPHMITAHDADILEAAIYIAVRAHAGQRDKVGMPAILHPLGVMSMFSGADEKAVAVLHDIIEDTHVNSTDLAIFGIPDDIVSDVVMLTRVDGETYSEYIDRIIRYGSDRVVAVKAADLRYNIARGTLASLDSLVKRWRSALDKIMSQRFM